MGLYRRLTGQTPDEEAPQPAGPLPAEQWSESHGGRSISVEEQVEIMGEINDILSRNRLALRPETFTFTPRKNGAVLPALVIAGAAVFTLAAALGIAAFFDAGERTLVRRSAVLLTAEAKLIRALKEQSAEQLGRRDQEIARIQDSLQAVARDRDRLKQDSRTELARRESELKAALERELAAERQKLEREGLKTEAVERQIADLQNRLAADNRRQIADLRRQAEAELAAKDASLAAKSREYTEALDAYQREKAQIEEQARRREEELAAELRAKTAAAESEASRLAGQLGALNEQRDREKLASDQLLAAYTKALDSWKASRYDEALRNLGAVRELLNKETLTSLPVFRSRLPVERSLVEALQRLFDSEKAGTAASAEAAQQEAEQELRRLQEEANRSGQELARLRSAEKKRAAQAAQLAALQERIEQSEASTSESQARVLALLDTKLRVRQALAAEPLASRYPGLYDELERFLEAYGLEQRQEGQASALRDASAVLEGLAQKVPRLEIRRLASEYAGRTREPFSRFVARLRDALK